MGFLKNCIFISGETNKVINIALFNVTFPRLRSCYFFVYFFETWNYKINQCDLVRHWCFHLKQTAHFTPVLTALLRKLAQIAFRKKVFNSRITQRKSDSRGRWMFASARWKKMAPHFPGPPPRTRARKLLLHEDKLVLHD